MKNKKLFVTLVAVFMLALGIGVGAYAASNFGTQADPLVAKSYLDQTVTPKLQQEFQTKLDEQVRLLESKISSSSSGLNFVSVTVRQGQTLKASAGCELILRSGSATGSGSSGLSDVTEGRLLTAGNSLTANHLYMAVADGDGFSARSAIAFRVFRSNGA